MTYQTYVAQMRGFRKTPITEDEFNKMQGIDTEQCEPCFLSPKYTKLKAVKPSLEEHEKRVIL